MAKELIFVDDAYWCVVKDRYLNVVGGEYQGFATTIRYTKKEAITAFLNQVKDRPYYAGITWTKARKAGYYAKYVHVQLTLV